MNFFQTIKNIFKISQTKHSQYIGTIFDKEPDYTNPTIEELKKLIKRCEQYENYFNNKKQTQSDLIKSKQLKELKKAFEINLENQNKGANGENEICYILRHFDKNNHTLHNINFAKKIQYRQDKKDTIQIDFIVISHKHIYLLEIKNRYPNYRVQYEIKENKIICHKLDNKGTWCNKSTITLSQNDNHKMLLSDIMQQNKELNQYSSRLLDIVVLSNPKGEFYNANKYPNTQKYNIILATELRDFITITDNKSKETELSLKEMKKISDTLLNISTPNTKSYVEKSQKDNLNEIELYIELKKFRKKICGNKPAYTIFKDETIEEIIKQQPTTIDKLKTISGIGDKNICYGEDILNIIKTIMT